jgi:hypothetical protein
VRIKTAGVLPVATVLLAGIGIALSPAASAAPVRAGDVGVLSCPDSSFRINTGGTGQLFDGSGVNIRTGPSTVCTSRGQGQPNHIARIDCYKTGDDGQLWTHLRDVTTGVEGWSRTSLLKVSGLHC